MLEIEHLDVYYGEAQALYDVSMQVDRGEMVAMVGSNGAGKTTLMRTVSGANKSQSGKIMLNGMRIDKLAPHRIVEKGLSLVPEGRRLFSFMTVLENLELGAHIASARGKMHESLKHVLSIFPVLDERRNQLAGTLSGGEQQMLAIGRALMSNPEIMLLDEPSLGLAPIIASKLFEIVKTINSYGTTILLVEQNARQALGLCNRAYVIETGKIVLEGRCAELISDERVQKAYLGAI